MRVIIAGSRSITDPTLIPLVVRCSGFLITEVVCGGAKGVDTLGQLWAIENQKAVKLFPADWHRNQVRAGFIRNIEMLQYCNAVIAIWDGQSRGTKHLIEQATLKGKPCYVHSTVSTNFKFKRK